MAHCDVSSAGVLSDLERLADLASSGLVNSPQEEAFDRLTRTVSQALGVPVSLVSLVDDDRQFFKSELGLTEPWASQRGSALSHSFCQYVVAADAPFVVTDARADERVLRSPAVEDMGVVGYAGAPVHGPSGHAIGALCAITHEPRDWSPQEVRLLQDLADAASDVVALRDHALRQRAAVANLSHHLRTGLTALQLEADGLQAGARDGHAEQRIAELVDTLNRHSQVLEEALRTAADTGPAHETAVDLRALLQDTAARHAPVAGSGRRGVRVLDGVAPASVVASHSDLAWVVDAMVRVLLDHGRGEVVLRLVPEASVVRVRVSDESSGLPSEVSTALTRRSDNASSVDAEGSLAERAARCGGRLLRTSSTPTTLDLLLPKR